MKKFIVACIIFVTCYGILGFNYNPFIETPTQTAQRELSVQQYIMYTYR